MPAWDRGGQFARPPSSLHPGTRSARAPDLILHSRERDILASAAGREGGSERRKELSGARAAHELYAKLALGHFQREIPPAFGIADLTGSNRCNPAPIEAVAHLQLFVSTICKSDQRPPI